MFGSPPFVDALLGDLRRNGGVLEGASDVLPRIGRPDEVWPHVRIAFVAVPILDGERCVEIGYRVAWDDDHTLGAR